MQAKPRLLSGMQAQIACPCAPAGNACTMASPLRRCAQSRRGQVTGERIHSCTHIWQSLTHHTGTRSRTAPPREQYLHKAAEHPETEALRSGGDISLGKGAGEVRSVGEKRSHGPATASGLPGHTRGAGAASGSQCSTSGGSKTRSMKCRMPFTAWWSLLTTRAKSLRYVLPLGARHGAWVGPRLAGLEAAGRRGPDSRPRLPPPHTPPRGNS